MTSRRTCFSWTDAPENDLGIAKEIDEAGDSKRKY